MTYFAIGESTGGAGERRLGPFSTPEEAAQAGRKETKDSNGAFVFRGVVDEANNQVGFDIEPIVSTNSVVRNAMAVKNRVARNAEDASSILRELDGMTKRMADIKSAYAELSKKDKELKKQIKALREKWLSVYESSTPQEQKKINEAHERFFNTSPFGGLF